MAFSTSLTLLCGLCILAQLLAPVSAIQFRLTHGEETCLRSAARTESPARRLEITIRLSSPCRARCVSVLFGLSEDVLAGELLIGDFSISPADGRVSVAVTDPLANTVYSKAVQSEGKFAHTASKPGEYRMCFHNSEGVSQKTIALTLSSGGRDYKEMAKKDNLKPLELELKRLEDTIVQIHQEMKFLQQREVQMRETNGPTTRMRQTAGAECSAVWSHDRPVALLACMFSRSAAASHSCPACACACGVRFDVVSRDLVQRPLDDRTRHPQWWTDSISEEVLSRKEAHSIESVSVTYDSTTKSGQPTREEGAQRSATQRSDVRSNCDS
jgi:hypothetical protein